MHKRVTSRRVPATPGGAGSGCAITRSMLLADRARV
jgi:hypothetical protein